jgi:hypothetical protein
MAAVAGNNAGMLGLTFRGAPIRLVPQQDPTTFETTQLMAKVNIGTAANPVYEKRYADVPTLNKDNRELMLRMVHEFYDACSANRLSLTTGAARFSKFRECLGPAFRGPWDVARQNEPNTVQGFNNSVDAFLANYFLPTDFIDQMNYMNTARMPENMKVQELALRVELLNQLMARMPGSGGIVPFNDHDLKVAFYKMMPQDWKLKFLEQGHDINDQAYTMQQLVRLMVVQESVRNARLQRARALQGRIQDRSGRGRGAGRGIRRQINVQDSRRQVRPRTDGRGGGGRAGREDRAGTGGSCPLHPTAGHSWSQCFGNPHSDNYRPNYRWSPGGSAPSGGRGGRGRGRGGGGRGRDAHLGEFDVEDGSILDDTEQQANREAELVEEETAAVEAEEDTHWLDNIGEPEFQDE